MEESLCNMTYEYLIELLLKTGYPRFIDLCETCPKILKVCEDPYLWNLLLQKDYKFIVSNNNFNNPKQVYEVIYKVYGKQFSIGSDLLEKLFIQTILSQNLEFLETMFKRFFNTINRLSNKFLLNLFKKV